MKRRDFLKWVGISGGAATAATINHGGGFYVPEQRQQLPGLPAYAQVHLRWVSLEQVSDRLAKGLVYVITDPDEEPLRFALSANPTGGYMSPRVAVYHRGMVLMAPSKTV